MSIGNAAISKKKEEERDSTFPDAANRVWSRKGTTKGFTTVPRALPLIGMIMDALSNRMPLSSTYFDLWFKSFDEMYLIIDSPFERAMFSGFSGPRAETTWTTRMRLLVKLGFIEVCRGTRGEFHHVLLINPYIAVAAIEKDAAQARVVGKDLFAAYHARLREVGAEVPPLTPPASPLPTEVAVPKARKRARPKKS